MPGKLSLDPAEHAEDFAPRYAEDLDIVSGQAMVDLGLTDKLMRALSPNSAAAEIPPDSFRKYGENEEFLETT